MAEVAVDRKKMGGVMYKIVIIAERFVEIYPTVAYRIIMGVYIPVYHAYRGFCNKSHGNPLPGEYIFFFTVDTAEDEN
jgi:hypothetical protein